MTFANLVTFYGVFGKTICWYFYVQIFVRSREPPSRTRVHISIVNHINVWFRKKYIIQYI